MHRELPVSFRFIDTERDMLVNRLSTTKTNPYKDYRAFRSELREIVETEPGLQRFRAFMTTTRQESRYDNPFTFVENCPIDRDLPELGNADPVNAKRKKKTTFIAEGFLQLYAELAGEHPISYANVNDGDVFQDIFPKEALKDTQSQKALGPIWFHKDLANHFARPDAVNIICLHSFDENSIWTTFVSNQDVLENLTLRCLSALREPWFYTPYDDLTVMSGNVDLGKASNHAVLSPEGDIRFFEKRTQGLNDEASAAVQELVELLHRKKRRVLLRPGDFVAIANNVSLHGKEIGAIESEAEQWKRWCMKTVNVYSIEPHRKHLVAGSDYMING